MSSAEVIPHVTESLEAKLRRQTRRSFGVFSPDEAVSLGLPKATLSRGCASGRWRRLLPRQYALPMPGWEWEQRAAAATRWAHPAWLSHSSAGRLWAFEGIITDLIEVSTEKNLVNAAVVVHRVSLTPADVTSRKGLPVTEPTRTLIDLAGVIDQDSLERALHGALRRGLTSIDRLARRSLAIGGKGRMGTCAVRALLALAKDSAANESSLEVRMIQLMRKNRLPLPIAQYETQIRGQRYRFDFAYPDLKLAIEVDGHAFHSSKADWRADRIRQNSAASDGWTVLRFTKYDLDEREAEVVSTIRDFLRPRLL